MPAPIGCNQSNSLPLPEKIDMLAAARENVDARQSDYNLNLLLTTYRG
jgi:hypothetical protein